MSGRGRNSGETIGMWNGEIKTGDGGVMMAGSTTPTQEENASPPSPQVLA